MAMIQFILLMGLLGCSSCGIVQRIVFQKEFTINDFESSFEIFCNHTNQTLESVKWLKEDLAIYYHEILLMRSAVVDGNKPFYEVTRFNQNYRLRIKHINEHFLGRYSCVQSFKSGNNTIIDHYILTMKQNFFLKTLGSEIDFPCRDMNVTGHNFGTGVWMKLKGDIIPSVGGIYVRDFKNLTHNRLVIKDLKISDTGEYSCYDRGFKVNSVTLKVLDVVMANFSETVRLNCNKRQSPITIITKNKELLYVNGEIILRKSIYNVSEEGDLLLFSAAIEDTGIYECFDENGLLSIINVTVTGKYPSDMIRAKNFGFVTLDTPSTTVELGSDVTLTCTFDSTWKTIFWKVDNVLIHLATRTNNVSYFRTEHSFTKPSRTAQKLILKNIKTFSLAAYQCFVLYEFHEIDSDTVVLNRKSVDILFQQANNGAGKSLSCNNSGNSPFWFRNKRLLNIGKTVLTKSEDFQINSSKLVFLTQNNTQGEFSCFDDEVQRIWTTKLDPAPVANDTSFTSIPEILSNLKIFGPPPNSVFPSTDATLTCGDHRISDDSIVYWFSSEQLISLSSKNMTWSFSSRYKINSSAINQLLIKEVQELEVKHPYECFIMLNNGDVTKSPVYTLPKLKEYVITKEAKPVILTCDAEEPAYWSIGGRQTLLTFNNKVTLTDSRYSIGENNSLIINRIGYFESRIYQCVGGRHVRRKVYFNTDGTVAEPKSDIIVTDVSAVNISLGETNEKFGHPFRLRCNHAFQADMIYWRYNGDIIFYISFDDKVYSSLEKLMTVKQEVHRTTLLVDYFSKYMFGTYDCFAVKDGKIYKSQELTIDNMVIEYTTLGLQLQRNLSAPVFTLTCTLRDDELNASIISWERNDSVILVIYPDGRVLTLVTMEGYTGAKTGPNTYSLTLIRGFQPTESMSGKYRCGSFKIKKFKQPDDLDVVIPPKRIVVRSNHIEQTFVQPKNPYKLSMLTKKPQLGDRLGLQCTFPESIGKPEYVYWTHQVNNTERMLLMHSSEAFEKEMYRESFLTQFSIPKSAEFSTSPEDCTFADGCTEMFLKMVTAAYSGTYRCYTKPVGMAIKVSAPIILDHSKRHRVLVKFRITDKIDCGNNAQRILWVKDGDILGIDNDMHDGHMSNFQIERPSLSLIFNNISASQSGYYQCFSRDNGFVIAAWSVTLKEVFVRVEQTKIPKIGEMLSLTCDFPNLDPEVVFWERTGPSGNHFFLFDGDSNIWDTSRVKGKRHKHSHDLTVHDVNEMDTGSYKCHVQLGDVFKEDKRIQSDMKTVQLQTTNSAIEVNEGVDMELVCMIPELTSTFDGKYTLLWFNETKLINKDTKLLWNPSKYVLIPQKNSLVIKNLQIWDQGNYHCFSRGIRFYTFSVKVKLPPQTIKEPVSKLHGANGYYLGFGLAILITGVLGFTVFLTRSTGPKSR